MRNVQLATCSAVSCGGMPLLRTNIFAAGVMASSSRCAGVSALMGRLLRTTSPGLSGITDPAAGLASATGAMPAGSKDR